MCSHQSLPKYEKSHRTTTTKMSQNASSMSQTEDDTINIKQLEQEILECRFQLKSFYFRFKPNDLLDDWNHLDGLNTMIDQVYICKSFRLLSTIFDDQRRISVPCGIHGHEHLNIRPIQFRRLVQTTESNQQATPSSQKHCLASHNIELSATDHIIQMFNQSMRTTNNIIFVRMLAADVFGIFYLAIFSGPRTITPKPQIILSPLLATSKEVPLHVAAKSKHLPGMDNVLMWIKTHTSVESSPSKKSDENGRKKNEKRQKIDPVINTDEYISDSSNAFYFPQKLLPNEASSEFLQSLGIKC